MVILHKIHIQTGLAVFALMMCFQEEAALIFKYAWFDQQNSRELCGAYAD